MGVFQSSGNSKENHEENQSPPVNFLFNVETGAAGFENHDDTGTDQGHHQKNAVLVKSEQFFSLVVRSDGDDGKNNENKSAHIGDFDHRGNGKTALKTRLEVDIEGVQIFAEIPQQKSDRCKKRNQHEGETPNHEVTESQLSFGSDENTDGVAHHGTGTADIGCKNSNQYVRCRIEFQTVADLKNQGGDEDDGSHFVNRTGKQRTGSCGNADEFRGVQIGHGNNQLNDPGEKSQVAQSADDDHHTDQKEDNFKR